METLTLDVLARESLEATETSHGTIGLIHAGNDLKAWWIDKEEDEIEWNWLVFDGEDLLYVIEGQLRLDFRDAPENSIVLSSGDCYVVPAETRFKGYSYPREDGARCLFLAISGADVTSRREPD